MFPIFNSSIFNFFILWMLDVFLCICSIRSLVSRVEDVNNAIGPIQTIFVIAFIISVTGMSTPNSLF